MSEEAPVTTQESLNEDSDSIQANSPDLTNDQVLEETVVESPPESTSSKDQDAESSESNINEEYVPDTDARLHQLEKEHETLRSQYMRIAADFDNFRKRQTRDQDDLRLQLTCNTLSTILPVVDNFERARQQLEPQGEEAQALHRSYQGLYKQLVEVLKQLGVSPMRVIGQAFDPSLHEAVMREPSEEKAEDIILEEMQRGYHLNGRVLRHALVKVSMGPGPTKDDSENIDNQSTPISNEAKDASEL